MMQTYKVPVHLSDGHWKLYEIKTETNSRIIVLRIAASQARLDENNGAGRRSRSNKKHLCRVVGYKRKITAYKPEEKQ